MTPAYASPEQRVGQTLSRKTDIWSWGVSVMDIFTGGVSCPHGGQIAAEVLDDLFACEMGDEEVQAMPTEVKKILRRCFTRDTSERWGMQRDLLQIKLRDNLVRQRVDIISSVRFTLKSLGIALPSPSSQSFARHARKLLGGEHSATLALLKPSLCVLDGMNEQIRSLEKSIESMAAEKYPECEFLTQITGVGLLTSLTFILASTYY